eukprot:15431499-Alexandrium_andersonii.AAC.1
MLGRLALYVRGNVFARPAYDKALVHDAADHCSELWRSGAGGHREDAAEGLGWVCVAHHLGFS